MTPSELPLPSLTGPPVKRAVMVQHWADVVFVHWRYEPEAVQRLLPPGVTVDRHDGSAWVALVPFRMERLGVPGLAPLPFVGRFPEINVRTYVRAGDRRGVWFFSLDVDLFLPTVVARTVYRLPYCYGRTDHIRVADLVTTRVERRWPRTGPPATAALVVRTGAAIEPDDTARFLTSRWGLVSATRRGGLRYAAVGHPRWPLHHAEVVHLDESLVVAAGLPAPHGSPQVMWSPGVDVRVGPPQRLVVGTAL